MCARKANPKQPTQTRETAGIRKGSSDYHSPSSGNMLLDMGSVYWTSSTRVYGGRVINFNVSERKEEEFFWRETWGSERRR